MRTYLSRLRFILLSPDFIYREGGEDGDGGGVMIVAMGEVAGGSDGEG